jgi:ArsR family transcriptional regulator
MRDVVKAMKALSDETRLRTLNVLLERECCVCEVMQALDISQTRASRNLGILHDAGFLTMRKEGLWRVYSVDQDIVKEYYALLVEAVRKSLEDDEMAASDRRRLKTAERVGCVKTCAP